MSSVIAVLGVSTLLGENLLEILDARSFPTDSIRLADAVGVESRGVMFAGHAVRVRPLDELELQGVTLVFNCLPDSLSAEQLALIEAQGAYLIDLTSTLAPQLARVIVPEINPAVLDEVTAGSVIHSPSAAAVTAGLALSALHQRYQLLRLNITSLCSAGSVGEAGIQALAGETARLLNGRDAEPGHFSRQIAFNLLPLVGERLDSGYSAAEWQLADQLRELLDDDQLEVAVSELLVPLFYGQTVVVQAETQHRVEQAEMEKLLRAGAGLYLARPDEEPMTPVSTAAGKDEVFVSRLRVDRDSENGFSLCAITDNLRKGGPLNAVQIAEALLNRLT